MKLKDLSWPIVMLVCLLAISVSANVVLAVKYHSQNQRYQVLVQDLQKAHDQLAEPSR